MSPPSLARCFITKTGAFLPGDPISNESIQQYLGTIEGEEEIKEKILRVNGIKQRHYALDKNQNPTHSLYEMGALAVANCLEDFVGKEDLGYLAAGSTNTPLVGPGLASLIHSALSERGVIRHPVEINSCSGICSSGAQALVNAYRAVANQEQKCAICLGVEQPSEILKSTTIHLNEADPGEEKTERNSNWFMSVFLRFMLSDGAGAFLLQDAPAVNNLSFAIDWTFSRSFANETPLCMKLESRTLSLSQDVQILTENMAPCVRQLVAEAMERHQTNLGEYLCILPHISSFYFKKYMLEVFKEYSANGNTPVDYWTNLASAGNTGSASIFIILDEFSRTQPINHGDKLMLFIPESGQFNFVLVSLTAIKA